MPKRGREAFFGVVVAALSSLGLDEEGGKGRTCLFLRKRSSRLRSCFPPSSAPSLSSTHLTHLCIPPHPSLSFPFPTPCSLIAHAKHSGLGDRYGRSLACPAGGRVTSGWRPLCTRPVCSQVRPSPALLILSVSPIHFCPGARSTHCLVYEHPSRCAFLKYENMQV